MLSQTRRAFLLVATLAVVTVTNVANASQASFEKAFANKAATGGELANAFIEMLEVAGGKGEDLKTFAKPYLDPAFVLQRASGKRYLADTYVPPLIEKFEISDVRESRPSDNVMVVRYSVRTDEVAPDTALVMSKDKAPRLTVFHWDDAAQRWKVISHANFNTPVAAVCDRNPVMDNGLQSPANPEDQALGENLIREFQKLVMQGDAVAMLDPMVQVQTASGIGYTTLAERKKPTKHTDWKSDRIVVTRNGPLVVVSHHNDAKQRMFMGANQQRSGLEHSLHTFLRNEDGKWKVIAIASFAPAAALPEGAVCVPAGKLATAP